MPLQNVQKYSGFLDSHMSLVLLNRVLEQHSSKDLESFRSALLRRTRLIAHLEKTKTVDQTYLGECREVLKRFDSGYLDIKQRYVGEPSSSNDQPQQQVDAEAVESIMAVAQMAYELGQYRIAYDLIHFCLSKAASNSELVETDVKLNMMWGRLSALVCATASDSSSVDDLDSKLAEAVLECRDAIESDTSITEQQKKLRQRVWLCHWAPFLFGHGQKSLDALWSLFSHSAYLNAIQTTCPYLLRYHIAVALMKFPMLDVEVRQSRLNDLVKLLALEQAQYSEPLSAILLTMLSDCNFDQVPALFSSCKQLIDSDFFLVECKHELTVSLEDIVLRTFAKIYSEHDLEEFAKKFPIQHAVSKSDLGGAVNLSLVRTMKALRDLQTKAETLATRVGH